MQFYNDWAQRILQGEVTGHGAFYGLPLYPYLLAFLYWLFGYSPFVPGVLQALLDAGTAVLIYQLSLHLFDSELIRRNSIFAEARFRKIFAAISALAWGLYVPAQAYSIVLMPTAWFVFVFWLIVSRISKAEKAPGLIESLALGCLIGLTAMGVATILFLLPLILAAFILKPKASNSRTPYLAVALFVGL
ncbi:MAG: Dolichyl-phosphate-mannose-protein mannosyltransferase, partial [Verrucomicrobiota bacterium]